jgi:hypothetical protein
MELPGFEPSWSAEFPNDNPALHDGASWLCLQVCGAPRAVMRPRPVNVRSDVPHAEVASSQATAAAHQEAQSAAIEKGAVMAMQASVRWGEEEGWKAPPEAPATAGWDEDGPGPQVDACVAVTAGLDDDARSTLLDEHVAGTAGLDADARAVLLDEPAEMTAGFDEDTTRATSLEALTLSLEPEISSLADGHATSSQPLELDAMDFVTTLASDDAVFEFDGDDATGALPAVVLEPTAMLDVKRSVELAASKEEAEPAATPDLFAAYVAAAVEVALATGHTRVAAALPALLEGAELDVSTLTDEARSRLLAAGVLLSSDGGLRPSEAFTSTAAAWRSVLRGATSDFSACGDSTLDAWTADLLKAFGVGQGTATDVRRELRRRGVAAFGMLLAA